MSYNSFLMSYFFDELVFDLHKLLELKPSFIRALQEALTFPNFQHRFLLLLLTNGLGPNEKKILQEFEILWKCLLLLLLSLLLLLLVLPSP